MQIVTSHFSTKPPACAHQHRALGAKGPRDLPTIRELTPGDWFKSLGVDDYASLYRTQLATICPRTISAR